MPTKLIFLYNKSIHKSKEYNDRFITILFIFITVILISIKLGNIYACTELYSQIDNFVLVYNF